MATLPTSITVNDGSATPVAITFTPIEVKDGSTVVFADKRKTARAFWPKLSVTLDPEKPSRASDHVEMSCVYPLTQVVDGVEVVYATARYERGRFILPSGMPQADRKHLCAFVRNFMDVQSVQDQVNNLDPYF